MDLVKELKQKSLIDFIQTHLNIELQKTGKNYCCPCPIHEDTSPSFYIDPIKNRWSCYGTCNYTGDIIDFIVKFKNLTFPEGIEWLAKKYNLEYKKTFIAKKDDFSEYYEICEFVAEYYKFQELKSYNKFGFQYLQKRRIKKEIIDDFCLGIAPSPSEIGTWTFLSDSLRKKDFNLDVCEKIGVIRKSEKGSYYDAFLGRIIIPVYDLRDKCIGFNTRAYIENEDVPKYLLSKETPIFKKNQFLFGINKSLKYIKQQNLCYFVEGCFDYFRMYEYGYKNTVPLLGGKILKEVPDVSNYGFIMDPDKAGIKYSLENGSEFVTKGKNVLIVELKKDPDDCTKNEIDIALSQSLSYLDFYLKHNYKYCSSIEHKLAIIDNLSSLLNNFSLDQMYLYSEYLATRLNIPMKYLLHRFGLENPSHREFFKTLGMP